MPSRFFASAQFALLRDRRLESRKAPDTDLSRGIAMVTDRECQRAEQSSKELRVGSKSSKESPLRQQIVILSDSTGDTAEGFVRAVLAQFQSSDVDIKRIPNIESERALRKSLESITQRALIVYTFASPELRKTAWSLTRELSYTGLDLLYPAVEIFSEFLGSSPSQQAGALHSVLARDYFRRIEAIEFTVKHDDGMRLNEIHLADIILVGVSRSSKTPTSIYLAHKGYRVANVPLVLGIPEPKELLTAHEKKVPVACLTIHESDLERIRRTRFINLGAKTKQSEDHYLAIDQICAELKAAQQLARKYGWPIIDVTDRAIEETASEILLLINGKAR
ncbi:MAG: kinase/pyrophosphorylase [Bradymonadales bacterium]|nr:MAG: kinase/pyrophosphorylase [Bradymonadales bacterium]